MEMQMNDDCHAAFTHASIGITGHSDMVYIIVLLKLLISDDGNCEEEAELGKVTMLGYIIQKLVNGSTC